MIDSRGLRAQLEAAQGEVKRLTRELTVAHQTPLAGRVAELETLVAQLKESRRELDAHWREREREHQARERALRDQLDAARATAAKTERELRRAGARLEKAELRLKKQPAPPRFVEGVKRLLASPGPKEQLRSALEEIARLEQRLSLTQPRRRR
ncbi:MAG: hypothetical protein Q8L48_21475 [Archangium sp.]|nr:hypothetical protein [Archangium sp.]